MSDTSWSFTNATREAFSQGYRAGAKHERQGIARRTAPPLTDTEVRRGVYERVATDAYDGVLAILAELEAADEVTS